MKTKAYCIQKYKEYKAKYSVVAKAKEFRKFANISEEQLISLYGSGAYTKLQTDCGDEANKWNLERTSIETIMRQYGGLAQETLDQDSRLPLSSDWTYRQLKPTYKGLGGRPHHLKWNEFPQKFKDWIETENIKGYEKVIDYIDRTIAKPNVNIEKGDRDFENVVRDIRSWSPARRRNSEGEYKVELRSHLKSLGYVINEEYGESNQDLLIEKKYAVEIKKDPKLGDYDRCFGQLARHLQHQRRVIAVMFDVPSDDNFSNFASLVDAYLNKGEKTVEVIKK